MLFRAIPPKLVTWPYMAHRKCLIQHDKCQQAALHDLLGATNERITAEAISLLAAGDAQGLGELIVMSCDHLIDQITSTEEQDALSAY